MSRIKKIAAALCAGVLTSCGASSPAMAETLVADLPRQVIHISDEESELCRDGTYYAYRYSAEGDGREEGCWYLNQYSTAVLVEWRGGDLSVLAYEQFQRGDRE